MAAKITNLKKKRGFGDRIPNFYLGQLTHSTQLRTWQIALSHFVYWTNRSAVEIPAAGEQGLGVTLTGISAWSLNWKTWPKTILVLGAGETQDLHIPALPIPLWFPFTFQYPFFCPCLLCKRSLLMKSNFGSAAGYHLSGSLYST